jgi:hypothetical protein
MQVEEFGQKLLALVHLFNIILFFASCIKFSRAEKMRHDSEQ